MIDEESNLIMRERSMNRAKSFFLFSIAIVLLFIVPQAYGAAAPTPFGQLGLGYGGEIREAKDIFQIELFWRQPLAYEKQFINGWHMRTGLEAGAAWVDEEGMGRSPVGRFSLMGELFFSSTKEVDFIVGFGPGFMVGDTEFTAQDLGGWFCLVSKIGFQFHFGDKWVLDYVFFHQSNAGIYEHNASLNMIQASISYRF